MAKKSSRDLIGFTCTQCKTLNYISQKSKINTQDALKLKKFCKKCKKVTEHKETKDLD